MRQQLSDTIHDLIVMRNRFEDVSDGSAKERMHRHHAYAEMTELLTYLQSWAKEA